MNQRFHLDPIERDKECIHRFGFLYTGTIPCTGRKVCPMCGTVEDDRVDGVAVIPTNQNHREEIIDYEDKRRSR